MIYQKYDSELFGGIYNPFFGWAKFVDAFLVGFLRYCQNIILGYSELKIQTFPKFTTP